MIEQLSKHSQIDINIKAKRYIDAHHTTEDIGYTIGKAISEALSERKGTKIWKCKCTYGWNTFWVVLDYLEDLFGLESFYAN